VVKKRDLNPKLRTKFRCRRENNQHDELLKVKMKKFNTI
jgi:hypothetical protein